MPSVLAEWEISKFEFISIGWTIHLEFRLNQQKALARRGSTVIGLAPRVGCPAAKMKLDRLPRF
jgi:hypothetical protein